MSNAGKRRITVITDVPIEPELAAMDSTGNGIKESPGVELVGQNRLKHRRG